MSNKIKYLIFFVISLFLFIGIWHGFPFTNVVADEMFFSGSVLRSINSHTILPLPLDVPYGTLTFFISYIFIGLGLSTAFAISGFNILALKSFVVENLFLVYGISRFISFLIGLFILYIINNFLEKYTKDWKMRWVLIMLLFTNILVLCIFHTGKVWVLSTLLLLLSFNFLIDSFSGVDVKRNMWKSILFAFLAFSNFPLMGLALLCIPVFLYEYRFDKNIVKHLLLASLTGFLLLSIITVSNFSGVKAQILSIIFDYTLSPTAIKNNASLLLSFYVHIKKLFLLFPAIIFIIPFVFYWGDKKNRKIASLSVLYLSVYVLALIFVDRWSAGPQSSLRYMFPVPFFLIYFIGAFDLKFKKIFLLPVFVSVFYSVFTLYLLSIQTTNYMAVKFVRDNFSSNNSALFINNVGADTPIPRNKKSYSLVPPKLCGSLCSDVLMREKDIDFKPVVIDSHYDLATVQKNINTSYIYVVSRYYQKDMDLIASFTNPVLDNRYYSLDSSGNYFDINFFKVRNFGPNIYIYRVQKLYPGLFDK